MKNLIKPKKLHVGDTVAAVSLSWGGAGDSGILWRYEQGKQRIESVFGLKVVEAAHALSGSNYVYKHPEKRAEDLMNAFADKSISAIFSCIGGEDAIRMLPYINFDVIRANPKIFMGYSDTTIVHLMCCKAGITSFYGPSILGEFAENVAMHDYITQSVNKALFTAEPIGEIAQSDEYTGDRLELAIENINTARTLYANTPYELLQGSGVVRGRLWGGCLEVLEMAKGTSLWPDAQLFDGAVLFFETSEEAPPPVYFERWLRNYGSMGVLQRAGALLFGKPYQNKYYEEYKAAIKKVLSELGLFNMPVLYNMCFGHNSPMCVLPYGAMAEVDCDKVSLNILESGVAQ